jgi:C-3',4' desaturase CrtD
MYDLIVIGSGIGGLTAGAMVARHKKKVLVLEANYLPGGCCSSYPRKGYIFESGATTLMGFDAHQPLHTLQKALGFSIVKKEIDPSMTVWMDGLKILKPKDFEAWLQIALDTFGHEPGVEKFWRLAWKLSNIVWKISGTNLRFPPVSIKDLAYIALQNNPWDAFYLRYAFMTTETMLNKMGLSENKKLRRFLDEQLMITAQNTCAHTPFLFAAPAICYTNYSNYYLPGGMISLPKALQRELRWRGSELRLRRKVVSVCKDENNIWTVSDHKGNVYQAKTVLSNIPVWNLNDITEGELAKWSQKEADRYPEYRGAFTMGIVTKDTYPDDMTLHHQIILPENETLPHCGSTSIFVSFSDRGDTIRCPEGERVLSISTHVEHPGKWLSIPDAYDAQKAETELFILSKLEQYLPGFRAEHIVYQIASTPLSWEKWTGRKEGTVGGIPQDIRQPLFTMSGALTPEKSFYRCGDTVYPGQGVPGVALGGIIAAERIIKSGNI